MAGIDAPGTNAAYVVVCCSSGAVAQVIGSVRCDVVESIHEGVGREAQDWMCLPIKRQFPNLFACLQLC
jgi:hypothetical protein